MTKKEKELLVVAAKYAKRLDNAQPEVGMGPSMNMIVQQVADQLSFKVKKKDIDDVADELRSFFSK